MKDRKAGIAREISWHSQSWRLRHHDSLTFADFRGEALFDGPTLYAKLSKTAAISAAWNTQVRGHEVGAGPNLGSLSIWRTINVIARGGASALNSDDRFLTKVEV